MHVRSGRLGTPPNATVLSECVSRGRWSSSSRTSSSPHCLLQFLMSLSLRTHSRPPLWPHLPSPLSDFSLLHLILFRPFSVPSQLQPACDSPKPPYHTTPHHTIHFCSFCTSLFPSPFHSAVLVQDVTIFTLFSSPLPSLCHTLPLIFLGSALLLLRAFPCFSSSLRPPFPFPLRCPSPSPSACHTPHSACFPSLFTFHFTLLCRFFVSVSTF